MYTPTLRVCITYMCLGHTWVYFSNDWTCYKKCFVKRTERRTSKGWEGVTKKVAKCWLHYCVNHPHRLLSLLDTLWKGRLERRWGGEWGNIWTTLSNKTWTDGLGYVLMTGWGHKTIGARHLKQFRVMCSQYTVFMSLGVRSQMLLASIPCEVWALFFLAVFAVLVREYQLS